MKDVVIAFVRGEEGLTMVEYAVAGSLVAAAAAVVFTTLGTTIVDKINLLIAAMNG
jgi:pilus assembly protein Flp/PilA